jgi:hypothetical protein
MVQELLPSSRTADPDPGEEKRISHPLGDSLERTEGTEREGEEKRRSDSLLR